MCKLYIEVLTLEDGGAEVHGGIVFERHSAALHHDESFVEEIVVNQMRQVVFGTTKPGINQAYNLPCG